MKKKKLIHKERESLKENTNGIVRVCPECGSKDIVRERGELYCKHCGYIIEESVE